MCNSFLDKFSLFIFALFLPIFCFLLLYVGYTNYKVHEFIKFHNDEYVLHKFCFNIYNYYYCSDDYFITDRK